MPSIMSLALSARRPLLDRPEESKEIISASGFVVSHDGKWWLLTNRHVVTGRERITGKPLGSASLPKTLRVTFPTERSSNPGFLDGWIEWNQDLYDASGDARWFVHPASPNRVDIAAIPMLPPREFKLDQPGLSISPSPYDVAEPADPYPLVPSGEVSIIGFPFKMRAGGFFAVWTRGAVATEPEIDYDGDPVFLVDARTRDGQSGSPVITYWPEGSSRLHDGGMSAGVPEGWELHGIYSGRTSDDSDLGRVWKRSAIREVIDGGSRDGTRYE